jgi:hypothetical protein
LDEFRIPSSWFAETFGPDKGAEFDKLYADQHALFKFMTLRGFELSAGNKGSVHTSPSKDMSAPKPAPAAPPASLKPIPEIQMFSIQAAGVRNADWTDSFIYLDGKLTPLGTLSESALPTPVRQRGRRPAVKSFTKWTLFILMKPGRKKSEDR